MRFAILLFAAGFASAATAAYKCVDEKGAPHFGDTPPAACANVTTFEINSSGSVVRRIEPSSMPSATDPAKTRDAERASMEAKRRDRALLDSYSSEREIDLARDRSVDMIKVRIDSLHLQVQQVTQREKDAARAVEAHKGAPSEALNANLAKVRDEKAALEASLVRYEKDLEATRTRFEADKKRWGELRENR